MDWEEIQKVANPQGYYDKQRKKQADKIVYNKQTRKINISTCAWCKKQYVKKANKQKYCSQYCRESARSHQSRMKSHRWYHKHKHELTEKQRWGLGSGVIGQHMHNDPEKEQETIIKELKRLGIYQQTRK